MPPPAPAARAVLVSVVIPCYNYADYLPLAVESAVNQTGVLVEVIIVDDCSTDESLAVAERLAGEHPRVRVIDHPVNRGPVDTFNDGLDAATGDYLVRLDADDMLTPGSLARAVAVLEAYDSVGLVYGHPLHFTDTLPAPRTATTSVTLWPGAQWLARRCRDGLNVITSPEVVMRMSVVADVGGQQPLAHTHDMEMWFRIAAFCDVGYLRGCDQAWHRDHAQSLSAQKVDEIVDLEERRHAFDTLFTGRAAAVPAAAEMHAAADRALDRAALELAVREISRGQDADRIHRILDTIRSPHLQTRAAAVRQTIGRPVRVGDRVRAIPRRVRRHIHYRRSFRAWHRRGEF